MYALTSSFDGGTRAILGGGQRFEFPASHGGLLADMLGDEFPECDACESRWEVCVDCRGCRDCGTCDCEHDADEDLDEDEGAGGGTAGGGLGDQERREQEE